ncbi:hypothetical protein AAEX28_02885 [Lentisphaerota bacterium WC36G]|nr:hypothetical protein LJT99_05765 [Lentisphaerae bacterium WC36]
MDVDCSKCGAVNIMGAVHCRECGEKLIFELDEALIAGQETKWQKFVKKLPFIIVVIVFFLISIPAVSIFFPFMPNDPSGSVLENPDATELSNILKSGEVGEKKKFYINGYELKVIFKRISGDKRILFNLEFGKPVIGVIAQYYSVINLRFAAKVDFSGEEPKFTGTKVGYFPAIFGLQKIVDDKWKFLKRTQSYQNLYKTAKMIESIKISKSKDKDKRGKYEITLK